MNNSVDELAMRIFVQMAAQHTVRHGLHESGGKASSLARESFTLAEAFIDERDARAGRAETGRPRTT